MFSDMSFMCGCCSRRSYIVVSLVSRSRSVSVSSDEVFIVVVL